MTLLDDPPHGAFTRGAPPSARRTGTLVIACHHKTGSNLLIALLNELAARDYFPAQVMRGGWDERKLPLSLVLGRYASRPLWYLQTWFEHEIDVPADGIRFLHFVRHPIKWVRSAYLYHRRGGPSERVSWLKWRVFRLRSCQVSYCEALNSVSVERGLLIEAVRCYPEILGAARAASSSDHLLDRLRVSLEQFHRDFEPSVRSVCEFLGLDHPSAHEVTRAMAAHDLSRRRPDELPPNATSSSPEAAGCERYLAEDPAFHALYAQPAAQMGFGFEARSLRSESRLGSSVIGRALEAKEHLLVHPLSPQGQELLGQGQLGDHWVACALQSFGQGGHLMMHPFIQQILDEA